jgi:YbbR domain-containing protein
MSAASDMADRLRGFFTENLNLKLLALGFALVLYSLVHGSQDAQRSMSVNLVMLLPPASANRVLVNQLPPQVRVTLRGPRAVLDDLRAEDIGNIQVDVHTGQAKRITLEPTMVHVPPGVRVEQIDPPALDLEWEEQVVRDVPVQVSVVGTPAPGFVVKGVPVAEPDTVRVHGPKSEVQVLQHVRADAFDVTGLTEGRYQRHLAVDRPRGRMSLDTSSVLVTAEVTREVVERLFSKMPVAVVGPPKAKTQPAEVDVRLVCAPEIVRALRPEQVVPRVDVKSDAHAASLSLPVTVAVTDCEAHVTPAEVIVRW